MIAQWTALIAALAGLVTAVGGVLLVWVQIRPLRHAQSRAEAKQRALGTVVLRKVGEIRADVQALAETMPPATSATPTLPDPDVDPGPYLPPWAKPSKPP